jgi:enoyl-CoA hydratase/carnithine racemase
MSDVFAQPSAPVLAIEGGVATITLNRPAQRNKLDNGDLQTLLDHFETVERDARVRVLVLTANTTGQPRPVFCAGLDIGGFDENGHGSTFFERIPDRLASLRPVTVCALNGSVYGGATDIVLACDLRIGLDGIEWRMPATALGLHYYPSGLQRYVSRLGLAGAKRAFLTARPFTAQQLDAMGLFEALVGPEAHELSTMRRRAVIGEFSRDARVPRLGDRRGGA